MPASGFVADVIGARRLLIIGLAGAGLAALIPLLVPGPGVAAGWRVLIGVLAALLLVAAVGLAALFAAVDVIIPATQAELLELDLPRHAIASGLILFIQLVGGAAYSMLLDATGIAEPAQLSVAAIVPLAAILALMGVARLRR